MFMVGVTLYLGVEEAVGRLGCLPRDHSAAADRFLVRGLLPCAPADDPRGVQPAASRESTSVGPATRRASG